MLDEEILLLNAFKKSRSDEIAKILGSKIHTIYKITEFQMLDKDLILIILDYCEELDPEFVAQLIRNIAQKQRISVRLLLRHIKTDKKKVLECFEVSSDSDIHLKHVSKKLDVIVQSINDRMELIEQTLRLQNEKIDGLSKRLCHMESHTKANVRSLNSSAAQRSETNEIIKALVEAFKSQQNTLLNLQKTLEGNGRLKSQNKNSYDYSDSNKANIGDYTVGEKNSDDAPQYQRDHTDQHGSIHELLTQSLVSQNILSNRFIQCDSGSSKSSSRNNERSSKKIRSSEYSTATGSTKSINNAKNEIVLPSTPKDDFVTHDSVRKKIVTNESYDSLAISPMTKNASNPITPIFHKGSSMKSKSKEEISPPSDFRLGSPHITREGKDLSMSDLASSSECQKNLSVSDLECERSQETRVKIIEGHSYGNSVCDITAPDYCASEEKCNFTSSTKTELHIEEEGKELNINSYEVSVQFVEPIRNMMTGNSYNEIISSSPMSAQRNKTQISASEISPPISYKFFMNQSTGCMESCVDVSEVNISNRQYDSPICKDENTDVLISEVSPLRRSGHTSLSSHKSSDQSNYAESDRNEPDELHTDSTTVTPDHHSNNSTNAPEHVCSQAPQVESSSGLGRDGSCDDEDKKIEYDTVQSELLTTNEEVTSSTGEIREKTLKKARKIREMPINKDVLEEDEENLSKIRKPLVHNIESYEEISGEATNDNDSYKQMSQESSQIQTDDVVSTNSSGNCIANDNSNDQDVETHTLAEDHASIGSAHEFIEKTEAAFSQTDYERVNSTIDTLNLNDYETDEKTELMLYENSACEDKRNYNNELVLSNDSMGLFEMLSSGDIQSIQSLLSSSPYLINTQDSFYSNLTPLLHAIEQDQREIAEYLISNGANVNLKPKNGDSPLISCIKRGHDLLAEKLMDLNCDLNDYDAEGYSAINYTVALCNKSVFNLLIDHGVDLNAKNQHGNTPLMQALITYKECIDNNRERRRAKVAELINIILNHDSVNLNIESGNGSTVLFNAIATRDIGFCKSIIFNSVDVNHENSEGITPLMYDCIVNKNNIAIFKLLLQSGAQIHYMNKNNEDVFKFADIRRRKILEKYDKPTEIHISLFRYENIKENLEKYVEVALTNNREDMVQKVYDCGYMITEVPNHEAMIAKVTDENFKKKLVKYGVQLNPDERLPNDAEFLIDANSILVNGKFKDLYHLIRGKKPCHRILEQLLLFSVSKSSVHTCKYLLENGVAAERPQLLHIAVVNQNAEIVTTLLKHGCTLTDFIQDMNSNHPFFEQHDDMVVGYEQYMILKDLILNDQDVDVNKNWNKCIKYYNSYIVHEIIKSNKFEYLRALDRLLNLCVIYQGKGLIHQLTDHSPVFYKKDYFAIIEWVCKKRAILNQRTMFSSPIHYAIEKKKYDICQVLISSGVDLSIRDFDGNTPLHYAIKNERYDICGMIIQNSSNLNSQDLFGRTPIFYAIEKERYDICGLLIQHKCYLNIRDVNGFTPLHHAVERGKYGFCKVLLHNGADRDICDIKGRTPRDIALAKNNTLILSLFK